MAVLLVAPLGSLTPETWGVVVGHSLLATQIEIHRWGLFIPPPFNTNVSKITLNVTVTKITIVDPPRLNCLLFYYYIIL